MRHYPHPYQETPDPRGLLGSVLVLLVLGAVLARSWRVYSRAQRRRQQAAGRLAGRLHAATPPRPGRRSR